MYAFLGPLVSWYASLTFLPPPSLPCPQVRAGGEDVDMAVQENQLDIVRLLVSHGADLNITDESGIVSGDTCTCTIAQYSCFSSRWGMFITQWGYYIVCLLVTVAVLE